MYNGNVNHRMKLIIFPPVAVAMASNRRDVHDCVRGK